ncbi:MAG: chorismate synthase, partial [Clostridia bacterium]|nr:chorismate synthase [Clostridia bacterium]
VEFGNGFAAAELRGSENNDAFVAEDGTVRTETNRSGGIQGGISNGMPILFRVAVKPTPSIAKPQKTVDLETMEETELVIKGRHDPCIALRAVPVVEAMAAIVLTDLLLQNRKLENQ